MKYLARRRLTLAARDLSDADITVMQAADQSADSPVMPHPEAAHGSDVPTKSSSRMPKQ